ncbi:MAG: hypothetical protein RUDDFDWM_000405 [Candidatus Fervidibacterota bacterium]
MGSFEGVRVRVPATVANLGSGFDVLGIALDWHNTIEARCIGKTSKLIIEVEGEGENELPKDERNVCYRAFSAACELMGEETPPVFMRLQNTIPLLRGLGSSAAARVGGIVAAMALLRGEVDEPKALKLAAELEGHTDNVAPALLGGFVISGWRSDGNGVFAIKLPVAKEVLVTVLVPEHSIPTEIARSVLPESISLSDAVFNMSRACLLVGALTTGHFEHVAEAVKDKLHQPYRQALMPWLNDVIEAAMSAGALGAFLSGSGSAVAALSVDEAKASRVAKEMEMALSKHSVYGYTKVVRIDTDGARFERW